MIFKRNKPPINLDAKLVAKIKKNLEKEVNRLDLSIKKLSVIHDYGNSEGENAVETEEFAENLGLKKKLVPLLKEAHEALKKIQKGTFGACESCGKQISSGRLNAFPTVKYCITCESRKPRWGFRLPWRKYK